jgi:predicted Zn-dependent protease
MDYRCFCKAALRLLSCCTLVFLVACTVNPLTGEEDFTGLMPAAQEASIGASQHAEIVQQYGGEYKNKAVQSYVDEVGQKLARQSDRQDIAYHFTVLNSPIVNAFALPGGYVYVTRGTLALANTESELASVLGHEIGHVAARHQAARYSRGVLSSLGASVLSAAIGVSGVSQAIGVGTNLYMSSYSREQESQADLLGVRYLSRAGYNTTSMADFLEHMEQYQTVEAKVEGEQVEQVNYFSSHPDTAGRAVAARVEAQKYPVIAKGDDGRARYLALMRGLAYGEDGSQGFVRGGVFYHPDIGFALNIPADFKVDNQPERLAIEGREGTIFVLDMDSKKNVRRAEDYVAAIWLQNQVSVPIEAIDVNGMHAATAKVDVVIDRRPADIRLVAIEWGDSEFVRMQVLLPQGVSGSAVNDMKRMTYGFHKMSSAERRMARPYQVDLIKAAAGDTVQSLAARMNVEKMPVEQFAALNGMTPAQPIIVGRTYKIIR